MERGSAEKGLQEGVGSGANQRLGKIIWAFLRKKAECSLLPCMAVQEGTQPRDVWS